MCARRFLIAVLVLTLLVVAGAFAMFQFGQDILVRTATPSGPFEPPPENSGPDYAEAGSWIARPDMQESANPGEWRPPGSPPVIPGARPAAAFFIHPTTYLQRDRWNGRLEEPQSRATAELFVRTQASAFGNVADIWAPRYRQAAYGAFLLNSDDATRALDLAYSDVERAFDRFLSSIPPTQPIILAGHSQGSLHLARLLAQRASQLRNRLVAAYVAGWPISVAADLAPLGIAPCQLPDEAGCVLSWQSFGEPANPRLVLDAWVGTEGATGIERERDDMLCVNPITGRRGGAAQPAANPGTLVPTTDMADATLQPGLVGARCEKGFLIIDGQIPNLGPYVLPGNNYHVYDYALFWGAIRDDAARRTQRWLSR